MQNNETRTCPICGKTYTGHPSLSRKDNTTLVCPDCGTRQALDAVGITAEKQEKILEIIHQKTGETEPRK